MKRSTKKILGLAASGVLAAGAFTSSATANTLTWQTTGAGNSQDWFVPGNWNPSGTPGSGDTALFNINPPSSTVNISANTSVGAIVDEIASSSNALTLAGSSGSTTVTLLGQTLTIPQSGVNLVNQPNVILAMGDSAAQLNTMTVGFNVALQNSTNVIVGAENNTLATGQVMKINGNITNAGATPAGLTVLGGGNPNDYGLSLYLNGNNTTPNYFTGGITIGNTAGTEGADVYVTQASIPTSGNIIVNEQSQLVLNDPSGGTYGAGTTLYLNGGGIGPGISQGSSGALRTNGSGAYTYAGNVNIGAGTTDTLALGYVVISSTSGNTVTFSGAVGGTGNIQKQGGGVLILSGTGNTWQGSLVMGNGAVTATSNSAIGTGDLTFAQSSNNSPIVNLYDATQSIRNLASRFSLKTGTDAQTLSLNGTALTINATTSNVFGDGAVAGLDAVIVDGTGTNNSVTYHGSAGAQLSLTGGNTYSGGTFVTGGILNLANVAQGSATGGGSVTVNSGGTLSSGGGVPQFQTAVSGTNPIVTRGTMSGALIVNSGGIVSPGGAPGSGLAGTLNVGSVTANAGSIFDFTLQGGDSATASELISSGALTLDGSGIEHVNVLGSPVALGTYTLMTYSALAGTGTQFTLGTTPNGRGRSYSLTTNGSDVLLTITATSTERYWSVGGGTPPVDGGGSWQNGSTSFYNSVPAPGTSQTNAPYDSNSTADLIFGNGGNGNTVNITGPVTVGGTMVFSSVATPYTIASSLPANTLTLIGGIASSASANITAPVILHGSQTFTTASGTTLSVTGGITETGGSATLTTGDLGTVLLGGNNAYTGGTVISNGFLQTTTASLPSAGGVQINNASSAVIFTQNSPGTYSGLISGNGSVDINTNAVVTLSNTSNSYSGATNLVGGELSISNPQELGTGAGGIALSGGTLQFTAPANFGNITENLDLVSGTSTIDTDGNNVTLNQDLIGAGNLTKIGAGNLTLTGLPSASIIGNLSVLGGSLELNASATFAFFASSSPGTFTGDLILAGSLEARLQGGDFNGGGKIRVISSGVNIISRGQTTIDNQIVLNENNLPSFITNIGATSGNILTITDGITGTSDVDFTNGAGTVVLQGVASTYVGSTTIDNGNGGEVQLASNNVLPQATNVHLAKNGLLDLFGNVTEIIGSIDSGAPGTAAIITNKSPDSTSLSTLIIAGSTSTNFAGFITDGANTPTPSGKLAIELGSTYTGTLELNSGTFNNYSGGTILNGGTLLLDGPGDALLGASTEQGDAIVSPLTFGGGTLQLATNWSSSRPLTVNPGASTISESAATPGQTVALTPASIHWNGGTLNLTNTGASHLTSGGTISVTAPSTLAVAAGSTLAVTGTTDPFTDSSNASKHVAIFNNGNFSIAQVNSSIAGITGTGTLTIGNGSSANTVQLAANSGGSSVGSLSILGNSTLDIVNNHLFITYGSGPDPIASIAAWIKSGFAGGTWTGDGITSSMAQTNGGSYGIGYADSADPNNPAGLSSGTIEIKYTLLGDANLDGAVNGSDFAILATNFNKAVSGWDAGDFNYDGAANGADFALLASNFNKGASQSDVTQAEETALTTFAANNGLMAEVPEPASFGLLTLTAVSVMARRRRRSV